MTSERYAEKMATTKAMGRARYETVALTPDRQVVAHSTLAVPLTGSTRSTSGARSCTASTAGTSSAWPPGGQPPALFRRRGRTSRWSSHRTRETNEFMVSINERMGFRPVEVAAEFVQRL